MKSLILAVTLAFVAMFGQAYAAEVELTEDQKIAVVDGWIKDFDKRNSTLKKTMVYGGAALGVVGSIAAVPAGTPIAIAAITHTISAGVYAAVGYAGYTGIRNVYISDKARLAAQKSVAVQKPVK